MASSALWVLCVVAVLLASSLVGVRPVPDTSCTTDLVRLLPCLPFVDGAAASPSDTCCTNLGSMVHDAPQCLCQALSQPSAAPVAVNMSRVMAMPRLCRLDIPSAAEACRGLIPQGPAAPPPPAASAPRPNATSTAPSTLSPAMPIVPRTTPSPPLASGQTPGYSWGSKVIVDRLSVALGFVALVLVQAF
ncbi:hypothetical protein PR202_gb15388 [Eleusine coracana subsp. coracana]|uniref:Bifunctional inhibitor/plant lipid transfer protein/seed storage helical domain-containing protein n=1 Tax=Eleusine coracana subsp. coracana TaxID=191504 RepID=A0AAV5EY42_ELECO|nr:hypothetical protein QOZ80_4BG0345820 [Eleusine coracana subsp. coracana]GJN27368.1 hypothetical protein PR202_gb15388 [Eleusine coracana subsp. coracana]